MLDRAFTRLRYFSLFVIILFSSISCKQISSEKADIPVNVTLPYEVRLSTLEDISKAPVLILLHGYGSHEKDLFGFSKMIDQKFTVICPRAPITLAEGKYAWYNINIGQGKTTYDFKGVQNAKEEVLTFLSQVVQKYDLNNDKIFIGGFSQGAIMSLYLGLTQPELIEGVIALSGHLYPEVRQEIDFAKQKLFPSIFLSHGRNDNVLSFSEAEAGVKYLENHNVRVDNHWYDSRHNISRENLSDMVKWIHSN